jgi:hypothetical protein
MAAGSVLKKGERANKRGIQAMLTIPLTLSTRSTNANRPKSLNMPCK